MLNLDARRTPTWSLRAVKPLTVAPSVDDDSIGTRCHYFIVKGRIRWATFD
jgi:hypothetical protein